MIEATGFGAAGSAISVPGGAPGGVRRRRAPGLPAAVSTIPIPAYAVRDFEAAGKAPADLAGRLVRLRGAIRRGPSMRLDHPEMVELLEG